jgi:hypothetical protein
MSERTKRLTQEEITKEMIQYGHVRTDAEMKLEKSKLELRRLGMLLLANEDGKLLLSMLEETYYKGNLVADDPHTTYFNLGRRDVVDFLLGLRDQAVKEK